MSGVWTCCNLKWCLLWNSEWQKGFWKIAGRRPWLWKRKKKLSDGIGRAGRNNILPRYRLRYLQNEFEWWLWLITLWKHGKSITSDDWLNRKFAYSEIVIVAFLFYLFDYCWSRCSRVRFYEPYAVLRNTIGWPGGNKRNDDGFPAARESPEPQLTTTRPPRISWAARTRSVCRVCWPKTVWSWDRRQPTWSACWWSSTNRWRLKIWQTSLDCSPTEPQWNASTHRISEKVCAARSAACPFRAQAPL